MERAAFVDEDESVATIVIRYDGAEYFCMAGTKGGSLVLPYKY